MIPGGTLCFNVPLSEKYFQLYYIIVLQLLLLVKKDLTQSAVFPKSCTDVIIWGGDKHARARMHTHTT